MATLIRSITINAPVERVFEHALDIGRFWVAPEIALKDIVLTPDGTGSSARIWTHVLGLHMEGRVEYTEVIRPQRIVAQVSFAVEHPTWTFTFAPADGGGTELTAQGDWHVKVPVVGKTVERRNAKEHEKFLETLLTDVKHRVEAEHSATV